MWLSVWCHAWRWGLMAQHYELGSKRNFSWSWYRRQLLLLISKFWTPKKIYYPRYLIKISVKKIIDLPDPKTDGKIPFGNRVGGHESCCTTRKQKFFLEKRFTKVGGICRETYKFLTEVAIKYKDNTLHKNAELYVLS